MPQTASLIKGMILTHSLPFFKGDSRRPYGRTLGEIKVSTVNVLVNKWFFRAKWFFIALKNYKKNKYDSIILQVFTSE